MAGILRNLLFCAMWLCACASAHSQEQPPAGEQSGSGKDARLADSAISAQKFNDWHYRCANEAAEDGKTTARCEVVQVARVKRGDEEVSLLTVAIARAQPQAGVNAAKASPDTILTALVPLNVLLPAAFSLEADAKPVFSAPYRNCNQAGCWVSQRLDRKMLAALQKGQTGTAKLRLLNGQNVNIRFSLMGLSAALAALDAPKAVK